MDEMTAVEKRKQSIAQGKALLEKSRPENSSCCPCLPNLSDDREEDKISNIMFEDKLISLAFTATCHNKTSNESVNLEPTHKLPPVAPAPKPARLNQRRKRSITNSTVGLLFSNPITAKHLADNLSSTESTQINRTLPLPNNGSGPVAMEVEVKDTKITLPNLKHYQEYQISVKACHDSDPFYGLLCTEDETEIAFGQTQPKLSADNLDSSQIYVGFVSNKTNEAFVTWEPPVEPNGRILNYFVKLSRESTKEDQTFCVNNNHTREYHFTQLLPGNYSIQIKVVTRAGKGNFSEPKFIFIPEVKGSDITGVIVGAVISPIVIVIILIGVLVYIAYKWKSKSNVLVSNNPNYIKTEDLYCPDEWEIARETLRLLKELGQGSFGTVYEGLLEDPKTKTTKSVAIKTLGDKADFYERLKILKEATTMKGCECFHVVKLIGVVSKGQPAFIVMELMSHGDLRNYLRKCRVDEYDYPDYYPPTANQIRQMAGEIADGMAYLAHRKIVHRDLAARNCLVAEDGTVKIADFGMARDVYMTDYYRKDNRALLPVRWMAPESLMDGIFTTMSDIWSYGIVLWEMVTLAEQPYQGLGNEEVLRFVSEGRVMTAPIGCPVDLYDLMKSCWAYNPKKRPTFMYLIECLAPHMNERFQQVSFFFQEMSKDGSDEEPEAGAAGTVEQAEPCVMEVEEAPTEAYQDPDNNFQRIQKLKAQGSSASGSLKSSKEARTVSSEEEDNVEIDSSPAKISPSPSTPSTSSHHQPESRRQSQSYSKPSLHADLSDSDTDYESEAFDSGEVVERDSQFMLSPKDAISSSEMLKLLPESSGSQKSKSGSLALPTPLKLGNSTDTEEYTLMSPPAVSARDPLSPSYTFPSTSPSTSSQYAPNLWQGRQVNVEDSKYKGNLPSYPRNGGIHNGLSNLASLGQENKIASWLAGNTEESIRSASTTSPTSEGSKESNSSAGSNHKFHTANGHGPFSHQQTAFC
uniref:Tyrosine-protein kinase receptor n=1 Tax=Biomphalaria glabrata TaxID=6526 RepID=A0A2C9JDN5_BIOGL